MAFAFDTTRKQFPGCKFRLDRSWNFDWLVAAQPSLNVDCKRFQLNP